MTHGGAGGSGPKDMSDQLMNSRPGGLRIHDGSAEYRCWWMETDEVGISTGARLPEHFFGAVRLDMTVCLPNYVKNQIDWLNKFEQSLHLAMFKHFEEIAELKHQEVCWETYHWVVQIGGICWPLLNLGVVEGESEKGGKNTKPQFRDTFTCLDPPSRPGCEAGKCQHIGEKNFG